MNASVRHATLNATSIASAWPQPRPVIPADRRLSQPKLIGSVLAFDIAAILTNGLATGVLAGTVGIGTGLRVAVSILVAGAIVLAFQQFYLYTIAGLSSQRSLIGRLAASHLIVFAGLITVLLLAGETVLAFRNWFIAWSAASFATVLAGRVLLRAQITRWTNAGRLARRAVIVGGGRPVEELIDNLKDDAGRSIQILGLFDDRGGDRSPEKVGEHYKLGGFDELVSFCREHNVDLLIITLPHTAEARILHLMKKLWVLPVDIRISALGSKLKLRPRAYTYIGKTPFLAVFDKPLTDWGQAVKSAEDRILASIILLMVWPVMLAVALAVKLSSKGPVLFKQTRYGFNNEKIGVYKFRSMYVEQCDSNAVKLVTKGDPRVTKVGAFIRRTSLDELPQLFNVLKGELSIVGPRPHAMQAKAGGQIYDEVVEGYFARHKVKPGITGWAQINGWRGETDTVDKIERRVEFDLQYIDNWSVFFDLYILAMTPVSLVTTKNAY